MLHLVFAPAEDIKSINETINNASGDVAKLIKDQEADTYISCNFVCPYILLEKDIDERKITDVVNTWLEYIKGEATDIWDAIALIFPKENRELKSGNKIYPGIVLILNKYKTDKS